MPTPNNTDNMIADSFTSLDRRVNIIYDIIVFSLLGFATLVLCGWGWLPLSIVIPTVALIIYLRAHYSAWPGAHRNTPR